MPPIPKPVFRPVHHIESVPAPVNVPITIESEQISKPP
jgi:hypothetical protein